jgi:heterodisulfide reductase subunit C
MEHESGSKHYINPSEREPFFTAQVNRLSGESANLCFHCRSCAGGCPFSTAMDYPPHGVIRLVQLGLRQEALTCSTIWICVGCHTCSIQCPMAIDISAIMDTLRHLALKDRMFVPESDILDFHREVLRSIERYGRTHKLEIMFRYKLRIRQWFADMDLGIKMLAKRKLDLRPSKVKAIKEVSRLFSPPWKG